MAQDMLYLATWDVGQGGAGLGVGLPIEVRSHSVIAKQLRRPLVINFILWLLFGALVGWLASMVMGTNAQQGALLNIVVGIVGAFLGGLIFSALGIGGSNINQGDFSLGALLISFLGAVILLGIVNLFRRGSVR
jgi:uncharacterized membrane protein YeaQ/YmgE (transglycosylase-associated protein family)